MLFPICIFANQYDDIVDRNSKEISELKERILRLEGLINSENNKNNMETSIRSISTHQENLDYQIALGELKDSKFGIAEKKFSSFIKNYQQSKLQSKARFWYAETFYRRENFDQAAIYYLKAYRKYPLGTKASDSLLKLSYSLGELGRYDEACGILDKLESEFPNRHLTSIKRSHDAQVTFRCKKIKE